MCMAKTRRLQILLEPEQFERLERASEKYGASIGSLIRDAVDRYLPMEAIDPTSAAQFLLDVPPIEVGDWAEMKRQMRDELAGIE